MRRLALQTLTWGTVAAAVVSAFWLASGDLGWIELRNPFANGEGVFQLPSEPNQVGHHGRSPSQQPGDRPEPRRNSR
jgi:hypothetical protein